MSKAPSSQFVSGSVKIAVAYLVLEQTPLELEYDLRRPYHNGPALHFRTFAYIISFCMVHSGYIGTSLWYLIFCLFTFLPVSLPSVISVLAPTGV